MLHNSVQCRLVHLVCASVVCLVMACTTESDVDTTANQAGTGAETDENDADDVTSGTGALRHAVFFSFLESSTDQDIQGVVDAFVALPQKVETITDFAWGTNSSPQKFDDGFTHCFLLTFADVAGRKAYLPHTAHKAFGDVLRPHMKDVFVIDYWGDPTQNDPTNALKHAVFFKFKDDAAPGDVEKAEQAFAALPGKIDTIKAFEWGANNSPETNDDGFTHCFMVTFENEEGREIYTPHAAHLALIELLDPVLDKLRVLDFVVQE